MRRGYDKLSDDGRAVDQEECKEGKCVATLTVKGMFCASCSTAVENALRKVKGVQSAVVNLLAETAIVTYWPGSVSAQQLADEVDDCGFEAKVLESESESPTAVRLRIGGMHCGACAAAVEGALSGAAGVVCAVVSAATHEAEVRYHPSRITPQQLVAAVEDCGFEASVLGVREENKVSLAIEGMHCGACSSAVERALLACPGVVSAEVSALSHQAAVRFDPNLTGPRSLIEAVEASGFGAALASEELTAFHSPQRAQMAADLQLLYISLVFTVPVVFIAKAAPQVPFLQHFLHNHFLGFPLNEILKWALTTPVQFVVGWRFLDGAVKSLRRRAANMDVLVALGTLASYFYSVISILHHHFYGHHDSGNYKPTDFFEGAAMLITFILLGKYLEARAKGLTSAAITKLMALAPDKAILVTRDGDGNILTEQEVDSRLIQRGDCLRVLPGAKVAADGVVLQGSSFVDEHMITGESRPVEKREGDAVVGGTINTGKAFLMTATRVGSDTALANITNLVVQAQLSKAPVQVYADKVSAVFVPIVVAIAAATMLIWFAAGRAGLYPTSGPASWVPQGHSIFLFSLLFGISVVVIACPCALGLATPTAVMVGTGIGAQQGILIKGGDALERGHNINVIVFDKTGTLTFGQPVVVAHMIVPDGPPLNELQVLVASVEATSEHPMARALLNWAAVHQNPGDLIPAEGGAVAALPVSDLASGEQKRSQAGQMQYIQMQIDAYNGNKAIAADRSWLRDALDVEVLQGSGIKCYVQSTHGGPSSPTTSRGGAGGGGSPRGGARGGKSNSPRLVRVAIGNKSLVASEGLTVPQSVADWMRPMEDRGRTCVMVVVGRAVVAAIAVQDPIKPEARGVIARLSQMNVEVHLVTGDNWRTARSIAEQVGIVNVSAEVKPEGKAAAVRGLQGRKKRVCMVGDGVNDAPALAAADLGMAIGSGTEVAVDTADYVLIRSDLEDVVAALDLSHRTFRRIQQNYVWAMVYNVVMIPVAAGAFYPITHVQLPPMFAGLAMAFSSVSVVISSLLLHRYRRPPPVLRDSEIFCIDMYTKEPKRPANGVLSDRMPLLGK